MCTNTYPKVVPKQKHVEKCVHMYENTCERLAQDARECKQAFDFSLGEGQSICCDTEVSAQIVLDVTSATDGCPLENRSTHAEFANIKTNTESTRQRH